MNLPTLNYKNTDLNIFINQWSTFYSYDKMDLYNENIGKIIFEKEDIVELYIWKNGSILSGKKSKSLDEKILNKLDEINKFKQKFSIADFLEEFSNVSFVWKIFLLHIISPSSYPIYDQNIHRAYLFFTNDISFKKIDETISENKKDEFYFETYLPFVTEKRLDEKYNIQDLDKAFFSFGQFLKKFNIDLN